MIYMSKRTLYLFLMMKLKVNYQNNVRLQRE